MSIRVASLVSIAVLSMASSQVLAAVVNNNITEAEVEQAQQAWGKALIAISSAYSSGGREQAEQKARQVLDAAYGYGQGAVLFKPTLASGEQTFRTEYDGALAYFVGGNPAFPDDSGFALKGWQGYEFSNAGVYINGDLALTMGHVMLTDATGAVTTVDKTWGFKKDEQGALRIVLHHSSLPFSAN
ncbi:phosphoribosyl-AMP cyclohydrolase [Alkalimonas sp.]|uniref:phosphoribosyl-AMP cyclohydrolase n=1 Tax=Alkalimonas sp. TaxID=1872453 RepID=UPI00263BA653|nr:phosphoribosyl-AMP cyclohydrolase [Alkalimonas sp.]MCC5826178.1 phosphoribosyl-AMP cyclohydrolase [Alkalimonas sp.]